jgi:hypothetical protein
LLPLRRAFMAVCCTALLLGLAWGCSASNDLSVNGRPGAGGSNGIAEAGNDAYILRPDSGEAGDGSLGLNPLCGAPPLCNPDQPRECSTYVPPAAVGADASTDASFDSSVVSAQAGESGESGASGAPGAGGQGSQGTTGEGGASAAAGVTGSSGASSEAGAAGASAGAGGAASVTAPQFSCQVLRTADAPDAPVARCAVVGTGGVNAPCLTSSDCGLDSKLGALGCVGDASAGKCEPYCCKGDDTCAVGSYCAQGQLRDALTNASSGRNAAPTVMIPVCVPAENCDLSTPYPCPSGTECACKSGTACVVVRADGTTTCAVPGVGAVGDACPCAWGNVCSVATNRCLKLCYTRGASTCGTGTCQASSELPEGWGVCVGEN